MNTKGVFPLWKRGKGNETRAAIAVAQHWLQILCFTGLLTACDEPAQTPPTIEPPAQLFASELSAIQQLYVSAGRCTIPVREQLARHSFDITVGPSADALLEIHLHGLRPLRESLPLINSLGHRTHYQAVLSGAGQTPLLTLYGQEGSLSFRELCEDIADEIANKLTAYLPQSS